MRNLYSRRLEALLDGGRRYLRGLLRISDVRAGLSTAGFLENGMDSWQAEKQAATRGVEVVALDRYTGVAPIRPDRLRVAEGCG
jgi:DNA-binding transcriptional MocR family regulator